MICRRCDGLMQKEQLVNSSNEAEVLWIGVWRCVNCGEILDPLIIQNRKTLPQPSYDKARMRITKGISVRKVKLRIGAE